MSSAANPKAPQVHPSDAPQESTGAVASDSLAAESIKSGGVFSENENANIMSVKGANSTLNTTDTSGASTLNAAPDGATREDRNDQGMGSDEKGVSGEKYEPASNADFSGVHSQEGYVGGATQSGSVSQKPTAANTASGATGDSFADGATTGSSSTEASKGGSSGSGNTSQSTGQSNTTSTSTSSSSGAEKAPNYAAAAAGNIRSEGELKPKGENLTEGDIPQTKTFTGDVGGPNDPGRVALQGFQKVSAQNAASAGSEHHAGSGNSADVNTGNKFDVLESERA